MPIKFNPAASARLNLDDLETDSIPGLTRRWGGALAEAATVCLEEENHTPGVLMELDGDCVHQLTVTWSPSGDRAQRQRAWGDPDEATEHGAYGVATLLVTELTEYTVAERARKGEGFDYWLRRKGEAGALFQGTARLEATGIRAGDKRAIASRLSRKKKQIAVSDASGLPSVVAVIEFGQPRSRVKSK